jgi:glycosyltransferase involved in cell wall biosynthesis
MATEKKQNDISIVIPSFNEEGSLLILYNKLVEVLEGVGQDFEIIFVDDGSTDASLSIMNSISAEDGRVKILPFRTNRGKADALQQGFLKANGKIIITMDADLQDDPLEIPRFLEKIEEGYDLVSGWKYVRHDPISKTIPSKLFNYVTSCISGIRLHDFNCGFKAYGKEVLEEVRLYGDLHRYIPALAYQRGFKVTEITVQHHPRQFGKSKYGIERFTRGFFDLLTVVLLSRHFLSPMKMFGTGGLLAGSAGAGILCFLTLLQIRFGSILGHKPLSILGVLLLLLGVQLLSLGILAEIVSKHGWHKGIGKPAIKDVLLPRKHVGNPYLSVVIPICNEENGLAPLVETLILSLEKIEKSTEIVFVDDGSSDRSFKILEEFYLTSTATISIVRHRKQFGKAAALQSGFEIASGRNTATMDGDSQDDPENIIKMLALLESGCDFINAKRIHVPIPRNISSKTFNKVVSFITGIHVADMNSGLKLFKSEVLDDIYLYGELQRFLPLLAVAKGYTITSMEVEHHERAYGKSKFDWQRVPSGFLTIMSVLFTTTYLRRPLHLFGNVGILITVFGIAIDGGLTLLRLGTGSIQGHRTLLLMGTMMIILGIQLCATGLLGEQINRVFIDEGKQ